MTFEIETEYTSDHKEKIDLKMLVKMHVAEMVKVQRRIIEEIKLGKASSELTDEEKMKNIIDCEALNNACALWIDAATAEWGDI